MRMALPPNTVSMSHAKHKSQAPRSPTFLSNYATNRGPDRAHLRSRNMLRRLTRLGKQLT